MLRYLSIPILKDENNKRYISTTLYPSIGESENDYYLTITDGDRLDTLAQSFYGDATLWWIISSANNLPGDSIYVTSGTQIRVPFSPPQVMQSFNQFNSNR
jgi:hypothetical protein